MSEAGTFPYEAQTGTVESVEVIGPTGINPTLRVVLNTKEPCTFLYRGKFFEAFLVVCRQSKTTKCGVTLYYRAEISTGMAKTYRIYQIMFPGNDPQNPPVGGQCV